MLAQIGLAASIAFRSGTDTSFHYDLLKCLGREDAYPRREARITRNVFIASAGAALLGGIGSVYALRVALWLVFVGGVRGFCAGFVICRNPTGRPALLLEVRLRDFFLQIRACLAYLSQPVLGWLMLFSVFMTVVNHIPYEFYQPYIQLLGGEAPTAVAYGFAHGVDDGHMPRGLQNRVFACAIISVPGRHLCSVQVCRLFSFH